MDTEVRYLGGPELKDNILKEFDEKGKLLRQLGFIQ